MKLTSPKNTTTKTTNVQKKVLKAGLIEYKVKKINGQAKRVITIKDVPYTKSELLEMLKHGFLRGDNGPGDDFIADFAIEWHKQNKTWSNFKNDISKSPVASGRRFVSNFDIKEENGNISLVIGSDKILYIRHFVNKKVLWYAIKELSVSNVATFKNKWG